MIAADCKSLPRTFLSRAALAATAALAAALTGIFPPHALAQSDAAQARTSKPLAFEVVSIRSAPFSTRGPEDIAVTPNGGHMAHSRPHQESDHTGLRPQACPGIHGG